RLICIVFFFFFFSSRRRHTRSTRDWSSDVCSSDLVVMVNVEADALAGPLMARRAATAGVVYSLAYGDQPALICELVEWARACGRSEERRVGKECGSRWWADCEKKRARK